MIVQKNRGWGEGGEREGGGGGDDLILKRTQSRIPVSSSTILNEKKNMGLAKNG